MMKKIYRSLMIASVILLLLSTFGVSAQNKITGRITDASGQGMPGVNVLVKGTTNGTTTDANGNYSLATKAEDILQISFIGYKTQEILVGNQTTINVTIEEDLTTLEEVVVTGYGEIKRVDMSAAQTSIKSSDLQKTVNTTIEQAIQGRAAGVYITQNSGQPGGGMSVMIRGVSTINGTTEPLYVIDGVQIQPSAVSYGSTSSTNPLAAINPSDIENVEILQGPSATAIYGSRGTNGVVLITTKRGKSGQTKISYDFQYTMQTEPKQLDVMDLPQYAQMYGEIRLAQGGEVPEKFKNPSLLGPGTNWQDELFKRSTIKKHQLSVTGGSDKTTFAFSSEFFDQDGIALGSAFKRGNARLNVENQTRDWLKIGANIFASRRTESVSATQEGLINTALTLTPDIPVRNPDGSWGGASSSNGNSVQFTPLNPVAISSLIQNDISTNEFWGGFNVELTPLKGLYMATNFNPRFSYYRNDYFVPSYRIGDRINDVASLNVSTGNSVGWTWTQTIQYERDLGKHNIKVMASHEANESIWKGLSAGKSNFVTNEIPDLNIGDDKSATASGGNSEWAMESYFGRLNYAYDNKYYLQAAYRADGSVNFGGNNKWGKFPSVSAAWRVTQEPFMQNVSLINELKLRVETGITGNQGNTSYYGPLRSVSTPWGSGFSQDRYSNESLQWEETQTNSFGFNLSVLDSRVQLEGDFYTKNTDNLLMSAPLPDVLGSSGEGSVSPPPINIGSMKTTGWAFSLNTINMDRNGFKWDMNINLSHFKSEVTEFYSESAFIDRKPWYVGDTGSGNNWAQRASVGEAPWLFQGYVYDGLYQSVEDAENSPRPVDNSGAMYAVAEDQIWVGDIKFKDLSGPNGVPDGIINEYDKTDIGNPWPKYTFGMTHNFSYKGFTLSVLFTGSFGNDIYNLLRYNNTNPNNTYLGRNLMEETFGYAKIVDNGDGPVLANPDAYIPRISSTNVNGNRLRFTDQFVEDGSYLRIKNISLTYHFPRTLLAKQNVLQGARIILGAQNIATFTKYKGFDPEVGAYVGNNVQSSDQAIGLDYGRYPITPMYTFTFGFDF